MTKRVTPPSSALAKQAFVGVGAVFRAAIAVISAFILGITNDI